MTTLKTSRFALALLVGASAFATTALAAQQVPSTADVGRAQKDMQQQALPRSTTAPSDLVTSADVQAPPGAESTFLTLKTLNVKNANEIPSQDIQAVYADLIGQKISVAQIYEVANKITRLYRDRGFVLSRAIVPQQDIKNGVVELQVIEGFISNYTIQGQPRGGINEIRAYAEKLMKTGALTSQNLERYLLLMNDLPGMRVRSVLSPSPKVVGGAEMTLIVEQDLFQGSIGIDNFGNAFLGEERGIAAGQFNSLLGSSDQWNGTFLYAGPGNSELAYYNAGFKHNVGSEGTVLGFSTTYVRTDPSLQGSLASLNAQGHSLTYSLEAQHPFVRSRQMNLFGGATYEIARNRTDYDPGLSAIETDETQHILRLNGYLTYLDGWDGYSTASAELSHGIELLGSSKKGDSQMSRAEGDPTFTKGTMELTRLQQIYGPYTLFVGVSGQYSADPLLASEEFGFGGTTYGRGFDSSEITGDHGLASKLELTYNGQPKLKYLSDYQVFGFYDIGAVWNKDPGAGQGSRESGASAGVGSRMTFTPGLKGDFFVAKPLTRDVPSRDENADDWRLKFSITSTF